MPWRVMRNKAETLTGIKTSMRLGTGVADNLAEWHDPGLGEYRRKAFKNRHRYLTAPERSVVDRSGVIR